MDALLERAQSRFSRRGFSRSNSNNFVTKNSIVLVGLRDWENPFKNSDLLELYDDNDLIQLKKLPSIDLSLFDSFSFNHSSHFDDSDLVFTNESFTSNSITPQHIPSIDFDFIHDI